jgi:hypothetical protein
MLLASHLSGGHTLAWIPLQHAFKKLHVCLVGKG